MGAKIEVVSGNDLNSVTDVNGQSQFHPVQSSLLPLYVRSQACDAQELSLQCPNATKVTLDYYRADAV